MTAPRARNQADPPSPPDRLPPRRGARSSSRNAFSAARLVRPIALGCVLTAGLLAAAGEARVQTELSLRYNGFTALPAGVFSRLSNLEFLRLNNNSLDELPADAALSCAASRHPSAIA